MTSNPDRRTMERPGSHEEAGNSYRDRDNLSLYMELREEFDMASVWMTLSSMRPSRFVQSLTSLVHKCHLMTIFRGSKDSKLAEEKSALPIVHEAAPSNEHQNEADISVTTPDNGSEHEATVATASNDLFCIDVALAATKETVENDPILCVSILSARREISDTALACLRRILGDAQPQGLSLIDTKNLEITDFQVRALNVDEVVDQSNGQTIKLFAIIQGLQGGIEKALEERDEARQEVEQAKKHGNVDSELKKADFTAFTGDLLGDHAGDLTEEVSSNVDEEIKGQNNTNGGDGAADPGSAFSSSGSNSGSDQGFHDESPDKQGIGNGTTSDGAIAETTPSSDLKSGTDQKYHNEPADKQNITNGTTSDGAATEIALSSDSMSGNGQESHNGSADKQNITNGTTIDGATTDIAPSSDSMSGNDQGSPTSDGSSFPSLDPKSINDSGSYGESADEQNANGTANGEAASKIASSSEINSVINHVSNEELPQATNPDTLQSPKRREYNSRLPQRPRHVHSTSNLHAAKDSNEAKFSLDQMTAPAPATTTNIGWLTNEERQDLFANKKMN